MAPAFAFVYSPFLALTTLTTLTTVITSAASTTPRGLVIELIHRDSKHSPYYNHNDNIYSRVKRAMKSSFARFAYLQETIRRSSTTKDFEATIFPSVDASLFFINFTMGQPPIPQFTVMDTGSSLLWVQCLPCIKCSQQFGPLFDPSKSATYAELPCYSQYCRYSPRGKCNFFNQCSYNQTYLNGAPSVGIIATEHMAFETSDEGSVVVPNVLFGCGHENGNFIDHQLTGVLGLGFGKTSLVTKLGTKFSYCIANIYDPSYSHSKLIIGNHARIEGDSTPLEVIYGNYYLTLESISVGGKMLDIDPNVFKMKIRGKSGVVIDSGSSGSWLVKDVFEALRHEVESLLDMMLIRYWYKSWTLCYRGTVSQDLLGFPAVTFHFAGGADLVLDSGSLFFQPWPHAFCMAIFPSLVQGDNVTGLNIIGIMAQQYYNVAYDIDGKKLSFERIDCELLDD
ncbi:Asp domain-containing protein [Cephalotus follicularis]|uniref:Asp domain-containing protein n=1 Tax=Cephalotus follicularis TaxID=3775 RepID=A0A1Q3C4I8_CEPFO|nr:Asp domain-containing protein [Cephalotus follicularis]